jgi:site-specific DNA-methyltransferase (adenine-specific)
VTEPYYQDDAVTIYHGDCLQLLSELERCDLLLTDPPYGIGYDAGARRKYDSPSTRNKTGNGGRGRFGKSWGPIRGDREPFQPQALLGSADFIILWGAHCYASRLPDSAGWLVWDKKRLGTIGRGFVGSDVDLAWTNWLGHTKVLSHLWDGLRRQSEVGEHYHPTQKPLALMRWCIGLAPKADTILDPFMGSGTTLRAAKDLGRKAIGIEIEERYCEIAAKRMGQEVLAV